MQNQPKNKSKKNTKNVQVQKQRAPKVQKQNVGYPGAMSQAPVSRTKVIKTQRPKMVSLRNGDCRITHREYVGEVVAGSSVPSAFNVTSYPINPGQSSLFQWLSRVAPNYESYVLEALKICYETEAPSSLGGSLMLVVDYDGSDVAPASKQQGMAYRSSVRSAPWNPCCHVSEKEDLHKQKTFFVRPGAQPENTDIKLYDVGNLFVMTQNVTTSQGVCGELYVEYTVLLKTPIYEPQLLNGSLVNATGAGVLTTALLGSPTVLSPTAGGLGITHNGNVMTVSGMEIGSEIVVSYAAIAATMAGKVSMTAGTGLTLVTIVDATSAADTFLNCLATFSVQAVSANITLSIAGGTITTPSMAGVFVSSYQTLGV
jgi:hypothetical protein